MPELLAMNKDSPGMNSLAKRVPLQREGYSFGVLLEKGSEMSGLSVGGAGLHALAHALGSLDPCGVTCDDGGKYAVCLPLVPVALCNSARCK